MKLNEIATTRTGLVLSRKKAIAHDTSDHQYRLITLKSFVSGYLSPRTEHFDIFSAVEEIDESYMSREGDVLVRLRAPIQAVYIDRESAGSIIPSLMAVVRTESSAVDAAFLTHYLNTIEVKKQLEKKLKGTTIPMIKTKDLGELEVVVPPLDVQRKTVSLMALSLRERTLLEDLISQKQHFAQSALETIIQQHKED